MADREIGTRDDHIGRGHAASSGRPTRARRPGRASDEVLDPKRQRDKHRHAAPPGSDLERAVLAEAKVDIALDWIAGSACRDDCESWNNEPTACNCGRWHLLQWRTTT